MFSRSISIARLSCLLLVASWSVSRLGAQTHSIKIGTLTYLGSAIENGDVVSSYKVVLDTAGVTQEPITFSNVVMFVKASSVSTQDSGFPQITTGPGCGESTGTPCTLLFRGGNGLPLSQCAKSNLTENCVSIAAQLVSLTGQNFSITLANGQQFCAYGVNNTFVLAKQGKTALDPRCNAQGFCKGASASIVLHAAPVKSCSP